MGMLEVYETPGGMLQLQHTRCFAMIIIEVVNVMDFLAQVKKMHLFENIREEELTPMLQCLGAIHKTFQKSEFIFLEGDKLTQIGVVVKGTVHMLKEDAWGERTILSFIESGELFGESFACGEMNSSCVSFHAATDCEILLLDFRKVFCTCTLSCAFHHRLIENMVAVMAHKNVLLMNKMEIVSKKTIRERLLVWLSQEVQKNGSRRFSSPMGRTDLAAYLCVDRSALSRELANMKRDGLVDFDRDSFDLKE